MLPDNDPSLTPFFEPRGVVVIGVSTDPAKLGYGIAQNLMTGGYPGAIHFVNPRGGRLFDRPLHTDVGAVPDPVDLAVILIPPGAVPAALEACGARGIRAAIIASGGFRETGPVGAALEEACLAAARRHDMRLIGPNCIGLLDTHLPLDTTFLPPPPPPKGDIAFISHSGAICAAIIDWSRGQGFGFSRLASLGNQIDVTETDMLALAAADPHTRVITLYLESISDGRRFVETARRITSPGSQQKPIVALKVGRTEAGKQAAASHTGALASREAAFDAALRRAGILRAETAEEMFEWAQALAANAELSDFGFRISDFRMRVAILTNAGGPGVMAADALEANGLLPAELGEGTRERLRQILAPAASVDNPVDMLASASPEQYAESLRLLLEDEDVDAVVVILPPPPMFSAGAVARRIIPVIQMGAKPVVVSLMGHDLVQEAQAFLRAVKIPTYTFPETAVGALGALGRQWTVNNQQRAVNDQQLTINSQRSMMEDRRTRVGDLMGSVPEARGWLPQGVLFGIFAAYGIETPESRVVASAREAVAAAEEIGYPVVLKIAAQGITHKSDIGGVQLNLRDAGEVAAAFERLSEIADEVGRGDTEGTEKAHRAQRVGVDEESGVESGDSEFAVLVQRMMPAGQEVIVGVTQDAQFGPLLMFGSGGVEVEGLNDVAFALAPLDEGEARYLLRETWAGRKLKGYRNVPAADETAVIETILRLGQLAADFPELAEIEINPLIVLEDGAAAVDGRARIRQYLR
ncbi:MAG: acetate--CoA ligase family protein [Candidatus Promineifilaceae bacterium]